MVSISHSKSMLKFKILSHVVWRFILFDFGLCEICHLEILCFPLLCPYFSFPNSYLLTLFRQILPREEECLDRRPNARSTPKSDLLPKEPSLFLISHFYSKLPETRYTSRYLGTTLSYRQQVNASLPKDVVGFDRNISGARQALLPKSRRTPSTFQSGS